MSSNNRYKEVEAMLYNHKQNKATIINIDYDILEVELEYQGCGSIDYSKERSGPTNKINSSIEDEVIRKEHVINKLKKRKKFLEIREMKLENALGSLDDRDRSIIEKKYFNGQTNKEIACKMYISEPYFCKINKKIINRMVNIMFNDN
ncbi:MAG: sigma factor-like helix-turn-helix DNA-binding protein [Filifactoraceae bacterium]